MAPDILPGYEAETLPLAGDCEGSAEATLVRHAAGPDQGPAVLYIHGYNDYFFCSELGRRFAEEGWIFYALDLRKHGRSLRPHQTPCLVRDFSEYFEEIGLALARIRALEGVERLLLYGHSTGGLIAALYAQARGGIDALFLNAPFFSFPVSWKSELLLRTLVCGLARLRPAAVVPRDPDPRYSWTLHRRYGRGGEWDYNEQWKRPGDLELRAGFVRASLRAQDRVRAGLGLEIPILVGASARRGGLEEGFDASWLETDTVLDPDLALRLSRRLGSRVERFRVEGALHDLMLSSPPARQAAWDQLFGWLSRLA